MTDFVSHKVHCHSKSCVGECSGVRCSNCESLENELAEEQDKRTLAVHERDSYRAEAESLETKRLSWELTARTSGGAFRYVEEENKLLRKIAAFCWEEMNHGLDLPSDVFDATEKYYAWKKKQEA